MTEKMTVPIRKRLLSLFTLEIYYEQPVYSRLRGIPPSKGRAADLA